VHQQSGYLAQCHKDLQKLEIERQAAIQAGGDPATLGQYERQLQLAGIPLSAFDAQRAQALVELLTTGTIAQHFNQVILISHSHAFDREVFHYHIHMENGQVIESDLPGSEAIDLRL
jgi:hypothetical protein